MSNRKWTDQEFISAVENSVSVRQTLLKLGLHPAGGNYPLFEQHVKRLGLDTSHFTGQAHRKGHTNPSMQPFPLEVILVENSTYFNTWRIKRRLVKLGILQDICNICGISTWQGKTLSLQLDHINGVNNDHRLENLRILCPNCHSQTHNFSGKNKGKNGPGDRT